MQPIKKTKNADKGGWTHDVLAEAGVRLMQLNGDFTVGVWADLDSPEVRAALRCIHGDDPPVRYLDGAGIPAKYKERIRPGNPVPPHVVQAMEANPVGPWEVRDKMLVETSEGSAVEVNLCPTVPRRDKTFAPHQVLTHPAQESFDNLGWEEETQSLAKLVYARRAFSDVKRWEEYIVTAELGSMEQSDVRAFLRLAARIGEVSAIIELQKNHHVPYREILQAVEGNFENRLQDINPREIVQALNQTLKRLKDWKPA